jgi:hypothetical protein
MITDSGPALCREQVNASAVWSTMAAASVRANTSCVEIAGEAVIRRAASCARTAATTNPGRRAGDPPALLSARLRRP